MPPHAGRPWKPSEMQQRMFRALLELDGQDDVTARKLGGITDQSSDGAAYTLRSFTRRSLVTPGAHDGDRYLGYQLTPAGRQIALDLKKAGL